MKKFHNPKTIHPPLAAYSHQVEISGSQRWLILSGQVGMGVNGEIPDDPVAQLELAFENIHRNLQSADMDITDIVKLTIYLVGTMEAEKRREVLSDWLQGYEPCMTLLYVAALASPKILVEIEAIACSD